MTFAWPHLLWLLLVPLVLLVWELTRARRAAATGHPKILRAEATPKSLSLSAGGSQPSRSRSRAHPWLYVGLALAIGALARPQWGRLEEPVFDQSREIIIAIDLSRSMLSEDVKPSRLDRAKLLTQSLLEKLTGERVGLVVFSGTAFLQSPLSADYEILREFLPALNPNFLPEGGTNYTALLDTSLSAFGATAASDRFLIILSDGEATDDDWRGRVDELKKKGIRVIGLGVGTTAGSMIPDGSGGLVKDNRGAVVLSKLESGTLRDLAEATGGVYQDASNWIDLAGLINATVDAGRKGQFLEKNTVRLVERFQWPLALALWCLLVSLYYEFPVRPKPRALKLQGPVVGGAIARSAATAALLLIVVSPVMIASAHAVENTGPELGRIYGRLANQDRLYATDLSEVAHATLTWGQRLKENGQEVMPGPVHDAIQAVDQLIAENSKIADWTKLRADLEALLQKPEDKKKQQDQQNQQQQNDQKDDQQQKDQQDKQDQQNSSKEDQSQKKNQQSQQSDSKQSQSQQQQQSNQQQNKPEKQGSEAQSAFGDMKDRKQPPAQPQEMQKVGGVAEKKDGQPPPDAAHAIQLQKLEQLRNQDSPAELFQLMDTDKKGSAKKPDKDW